MGEIKHLDSWYDYENNINKNALLRYCIHDVYMLDKLILEFNLTICQLLYDIYYEIN